MFELSTIALKVSTPKLCLSLAARLSLYIYYSSVSLDCDLCDETSGEIFGIRSDNCYVLDSGWTFGAYGAES